MSVALHNINESMLHASAADVAGQDRLAGQHEVHGDARENTAWVSVQLVAKVVVAWE